MGKSKSGLGLKSDLGRRALDLDLTWTRPLADLDLLGLILFSLTPGRYSVITDESQFFSFCCLRASSRFSLCNTAHNEMLSFSSQRSLIDLLSTLLRGGRVLLSTFEATVVYSL